MTDKRTMDYAVTINGLPGFVQSYEPVLRYEEIVDLAGGSREHGPSVWSIVVHYPKDTRSDRIVAPGQSAPLVNGMRISIADTSNA